MNDLLSISNLQTQFNTKHGTVRAVNNLDLTVERGEILGIVGESGSGKSVTALSIMQLIEDPGEIVNGSIRLTYDGARDLADSNPSEVGKSIFPDQGTVELNGASESLMREIRGGEIGMIFQDPMTSLNPTMKVGRQIGESLELHRFNRKRKDSWLNAIREVVPFSHDMPEEVRREVLSLLEEVGIPEPSLRMDEYPMSLSGGMRQRILIAIALACKPRLLIADEPTTALDVTVQAQILDIVKDLQQRFGMSVIFITHDLGVIAEICDRVAVMYAGEILEIGPVKQIFNNPSHPYTYTLMESIPAEDKDRLTPIKGNVPDLIDMDEGCPFAPRCPWVKDDCVGQPIPYLDHGSEGVDHRSKCILPTIPKNEYRPDHVDVVQTSRSNRLLVQAENLKKYYDTSEDLIEKYLGLHEGELKAVDGIDLRIYEGETLGLVGESGCGKSTTGEVLLHLERPTDGTVVFAGTELTEMSAKELNRKRKDMQMIFQEPLSSLNPRMTVGQILMEPLKVHNLAAGHKMERVSELIEAVGLEEAQRDRYPHELSGGQAQRVGIARALAVDPDFIVADEPVSALDVSVQAQIINLLKDLQEEYNLTYLFIAHDLSVVRHISDRVAVMYLGKIVEVAETADLFANPRHPYTQALLSAIPSPDPEASTEKRIILEGAVPSPIHPPSGCNFRTRCPKVIPPEGIEVTQTQYREIMSYRHRIEQQDIDIDSIKSRIGDDVEDPKVEFREILENRYFTVNLGEEISKILTASYDALFENDWDAAATVLFAEFQSICEKSEPELQDEHHPAACHLVEQSESNI